MADPKTTSKDICTLDYTKRKYAVRHPAAFINNIHEEGTKEEAVKYLQETWDDLCDARAEILRLTKEER